MSRRTPLRNQTFSAWGKPLPYFIHRYNDTWLNERCVEIAIAQEFLRTNQGRGLEFGHVLSHYGISGNREIVDKYERDKLVTNIDIMDYNPAFSFDYIIAISTIEHVGWDEPHRDPEKANSAFHHLRSMLGPEGRMLITAPLGYNPVLDSAVVQGKWKADREACFIRDGRSGWHQETPVRVIPWELGDVWPPAIWVGEFGRSSF
jgi:hypothetical protein